MCAESRSFLTAGARAGGTIAFAVLLVTLGAIGYWMLFSHFAGYDDEGYILMSAREYFARGQLYDEVYTQYGPAYYVLLDLLQRVIGPLDNASGRWLTLGLWLGTATSCGVMVRRQTKSWSLALFTLGATFLYLYFMPDEPFHPGGPIIFILAASSAGLLELVGKGRWAVAATVAGITGSILILIKINVGIFYFAGVGAWTLLNVASAPLRRAAPVLVPVGLTALAAALMHSLWREPWIHHYLALFAIGTVTVTATLRGEALLGWRHVGRGLFAAGAVAVAILLVVHLRGTSIAGLIDGVLLRPLRHPGSYSYAVDWRPGSLVLGFVSLVIAVWQGWKRRTDAAMNADRIVATLRFVQAAALVIAVVLLMQARVIGAVFSYVAPIIWISLVPLGPGRPAGGNHAGRGLLAFILLLQYLHAFPVAGSQESWGTFLLIPLIALGLSDLRSHPVGRNGWWAGAALRVVVFGKVAWTAVETQRTFDRGAKLGLPGAEHIRLPSKLRSAYEILTLNAVTHGNMLFSLPGMYSFNLWTGLPTPTPKNTTLWFLLLTEDEQRAIIRSLEQVPRACIIIHETLIELMRAGNVVMQGPLVDYVNQNFSPAFRVEGFSFLVRTGRPIAPINLARSGATPSQIEFFLAGTPNAVASITTRDLSEPTAAPLRPNAAITSVTLTPISSSGHRAGPSAVTALPLRINGLAHVSLELTPGLLPPDRTTVALELRDADGQVVATVRFDER